jgi:hypothetical protein
VEGLAWLKPLPQPFMHVLFAIMAFLSLMISVGYFFRFSSLLFIVIYLYVSSIDKAQAHLFSNFFLLTTVFLAILPSHRYFSLDILRNPSLRVDFIPRWCVWVIKLQVAFLFINAGMAKLNQDWLLQAQPFTRWVELYWSGTAIGNILIKPSVAIITCWLIVFIELAGPVAMFFSRTKTKVYIVLSLYLLSSFILFPAGFLPVQMILLSTVFLGENLHHNLTSRIAYFLNDFISFNPKVFKSGRNLMLAYKNKLIIPLFFTWIFGLLIISQLNGFLQDFRTGIEIKSLRISDELIINEQQGRLRLFLVHRDSIKTFEIDLNKDLNKEQIASMSVRPDLLLQYIRHVKAQYVDDESDYSMHAEAFISQNGKDFRPYINPEINLAEFDGAARDLIIQQVANNNNSKK